MWSFSVPSAITNGRNSAARLIIASICFTARYPVVHGYGINYSASASDSSFVSARVARGIYHTIGSELHAERRDHSPVWLDHVSALDVSRRAASRRWLGHF